MPGCTLEDQRLLESVIWGERRGLCNELEDCPSSTDSGQGWMPSIEVACSDLSATARPSNRHSKKVRENIGDRTRPISRYQVVSAAKRTAEE